MLSLASVMSSGLLALSVGVSAPAIESAPQIQPVNEATTQLEATEVNVARWRLIRRGSGRRELLA